MHMRWKSTILGAVGLLWIPNIAAQAQQYEGGMFVSRGTMHHSNTPPKGHVKPHPIRDHALTSSNQENKPPKNLKGPGGSTSSWRYNPKRVNGQIIQLESSSPSVQLSPQGATRPAVSSPAGSFRR